MRSINAIDYIATPDTGTAPTKVRRASWGKESLIFTDIYQEDINIVTWQRDLAQSLKDSVSEFLVSNPGFQSTLTVTPQSALSDIQKAFGSVDQSILVENIAELVDIFCSLFEISHAGLRLSALDRAMCPKFHVDKVPCRLVTTFQGVATQWLPHHAVDRTKLGLGSNGLPDKESGLYQHHDDIQQLSCGDVALLKGEVWYNNENAGLVHRSPALSAGKNRLLLTLDFAN